MSAATTETTPTMIAPTARLRRMVSGTSTMPTMAKTNARPLNPTARLAVAPAVPMASATSRPWVRSSPKRDRTNSE